MSSDLGAILRRIDRRQRTVRANSGERVSDRSVSLDAGLSADYLRSLRRQYDRGTQVGVTTPAIAAVAKALKTTPEWLLHGIGPEEPGAPEDHVEIRFTWSVVADGDHFVVEERLGNAPMKRWGPVPSRESARALIQERLHQPNLLQDALKHRK
ncbi:MAG: hypothetical protein WAV38_36430 [Xanthobacteraceae bacterium]|jgi:hypothetical protein